MLNISNLEPKITDKNIECWIVFEIKNLILSGLILRRFLVYVIESMHILVSILKREPKVEIKKAIIPEGSKYYIDIDGETIVANKVWVKEKYKGD